MYDVWPDTLTSWKIPPTKALEEVGGAEVVEEVDVEEGVVLVLEDEEEEEEEEEEVLVGVGLLLGGVVGSGALEETAGVPWEPSVLKTTMLAVLPLGTVTTQKAALPTPLVATGLSRPPTPPLEGSMAQGRPLQPPSGHSILRP